MDPADLLREARRRSELTQAQVASRAGVHVSLVSAYERGRRAPGVALLERLLAAAGLQLSVALEPLGADLDARVRQALAATPGERVYPLQLALADLPELLAEVPFIVEGLTAALLQGAPVPAPRIDVRIPDDDQALERAGRALEAHGARVWLDENGRHVAVGRHAYALRELDPSRWMVGLEEYQFRLAPADQLQVRNWVEVDGVRLPVLGLWELESADPAVSRVLARTRELAAVAGDES